MVPALVTGIAPEIPTSAIPAIPGKRGVGNSWNSARNSWNSARNSWNSARNSFRNSKNDRFPGIAGIADVGISGAIPVTSAIIAKTKFANMT